MSSFARRRQAEWMDEAGADPAVLHRSLRFIRRINAMLGYSRATLAHLQRFSRRWDPDRPITILDVATGSADIPRAILDWATRRGVNVRVVGLDRHPETARLAQLNIDPCRADSRTKGPITIVRGDALHLPFESGSFDYVMTNMFLHHLDESDVVKVLREMDRVARRGIIAADLLRHRRAYAWITLFTLCANPMVRHDARASVAQAFVREEVKDLTERAGLKYARYFRHFGHRFVLAGEKA